MSESRSRKYNKGRLPREKRTISIFGATSYIDGQVVKDQSGRFYKCWNCGFVCNTDRDKLGDGEGFYVTDVPDYPFVYNQGASSYEHPCDPNTARWDTTISVDTITTPHMMKLDSQGNPVTVIHNNISIITSGCPHCGCKNYR